MFDEPPFEDLPPSYQDLKLRWLPSSEQFTQADALLSAGYDQPRDDGERGVYTTHLLVNKEYGFWTTDVEVVHLDGLFLTREAACTFVHRVAEIRFNEGGQPVTGGYAWHPKIQGAAVFEDIGSVFPIPEWSHRNTNPT